MSWCLFVFGNLKPQFDLLTLILWYIKYEMSACVVDMLIIDYKLKCQSALHNFRRLIAYVVAPDINHDVRKLK